jgi:hypothetical protein
MGVAEVKPWGIILDQLGGQSRLIAMLGASHFGHGDGGLSLQFRFKGSSKVNFMKVKLDLGLDLYSVEFWKLGSKSQVKVQAFDSVYAEDLKYLFERVSGLYLSL